MSPNVHHLCTGCWRNRNPEVLPVVMVPIHAEICCSCGVVTSAGIIARIDDLKYLECRGVHDRTA